MTSLSYIALSLPWSIAGVLVGWFMARSTAAVEAIADAVTKEDTVPEAKPRRPRFTSTNLIGVLVVLLGIATAVQSYAQSDATERLAVCQRAYSDGFADALDARTQANTEAQLALDNLMSTVGDVLTSADPAARDRLTAAVSEYLSKRVEAKKTQAANPYPPAPRDACEQMEG